MISGQPKRRKLEKVELEKSTRSKVLEENVDDKMEEKSMTKTGNL
jgi:hypothetical protein